MIRRGDPLRIEAVDPQALRGVKPSTADRLVAVPRSGSSLDDAHAEGRQEVEACRLELSALVSIAGSAGPVDLWR